MYVFGRVCVCCNDIIETLILAHFAQAHLHTELLMVISRISDLLRISRIQKPTNKM